jgi:hypothetical protein
MGPLPQCLKCLSVEYPDHFLIHSNQSDRHRLTLASVWLLPGGWRLLWCAAQCAPSVDRPAVPWPLLVVFLGRSSSSERARAADLLVLLEKRARRAGDAVQRRVEEEGERPADPRPAVPCSSSSGRALVIHSSSSPPSDPRTTVPCSSSWCSAAPVLGPCCSAARSRRHLLQICSTSAARLPGNLVPAEVLILESAAYV